MLKLKKRLLLAAKHLLCLFMAVVTFVVGLLAFRATERKFILFV